MTTGRINQVAITEVIRIGRSLVVNVRPTRAPTGSVTRQLGRCRSRDLAPSTTDSTVRGTFTHNARRMQLNALALQVACDSAVVQLRPGSRSEFNEPRGSAHSRHSGT